jgi:hypothetical protein
MLATEGNHRPWTLSVGQVASLYRVEALSLDASARRNAVKSAFATTFIQLFFWCSILKMPSFC